jgi:putative hemolysin
LVSLITTIIIFVFAEILPKVIVLRWKNKFFLVFAGFFVFLYWLFCPIIFLTHWIALGFLKILSAPRLIKLPKFTKDEIRMASKRTLPIIEQSFVARLFEFKHKTAKDIMVPKKLICSAPITSTTDELKTLISQSGYSRIPIYDKTIDNIAGYVFARDLLSSVILSRSPEQSEGAAKNLALKDILKPCKSISETTPISILLDELGPVGSRPGGTVVVVKDANNKTTGILTMEDVIEELFGEIEDEYDISDT